MLAIAATNSENLMDAVQYRGKILGYCRIWQMLHSSSLEAMTVRVGRDSVKSLSIRAQDFNVK